jgi:hypothetical protein
MNDRIKVRDGDTMLILVKMAETWARAAAADGAGGLHQESSAAVESAEDQP